MMHLIHWTVNHSRLADRFDSFLIRRVKRYARWRFRFEAAELRKFAEQLKRAAREDFDPDFCATCGRGNVHNQN